MVRKSCTGIVPGRARARIANGIANLKLLPRNLNRRKGSNVGAVQLYYALTMESLRRVATGRAAGAQDARSALGTALCGFVCGAPPA